MSVKERIVAIRLAEKVARNREYAEGIGVFVRVGKGVESGEWEKTKRRKR
ncbi:MAG: hypothetical protein IJZ55_11195 [Lachnospiraceae bacterium]|nr:hypothetical protein [Lachnospiraceae bacterium]